MIEIMLLSGGTPYANFKDLSFAWYVALFSLFNTFIKRNSSLFIAWPLYLCNILLRLLILSHTHAHSSLSTINAITFQGS